MTLIGELDRGGRTELKDAVEKAVTAEQNDDPREERGANKNTHFELEFGETGKPAVLYVERLPSSQEKGVEIMLWADRSWFAEDDPSVRLSPSDGEAPLGTFADNILEVTSDALGTSHKPSFQYHTTAPPSIVFSAVYYI